eukprot:3548703-Prymnesium_polylepis.1
MDSRGARNGVASKSRASGLLPTSSQPTLYRKYIVQLPPIMWTFGRLMHPPEASKAGRKQIRKTWTVCGPS